MARMFPRAIVWDPKVHHHFIVCVDHNAERCTLSCNDCGDRFDFPVSRIDDLRRLLSNDDDAQCILWIELNGQ